MTPEITITAIAKELKPTPAKVSHALNNHSHIGETTKRLVPESAKNFNAPQNEFASSSRFGKEALEYFFNLYNSPDAIFSTKDFIAFEETKTAIHEKTEIPENSGNVRFARQSFCKRMSDSSSSTHQQTVEKELLSKIAKGDVAAFGNLYEHYRRKVYFIAWKLLKTETESEDAAQDIFAKVWVNREKLGEIEHFNGWLNMVIRNHLYNCLRKKANEETFIHETSRESRYQREIAPDEVELRELQTLLDQGVNSLPAQQKKVFQLSRMEGFKHSEISETLGISTETVKKHITQAVSRIKNFLREKAK